MTRITIDGTAYDIAAPGNLLAAVLGLGLDLPYFCWHPALGSIGSCRQCAVVQFQSADDTRGRLVMACMTPVAAGMIVSVADQRARDFRAGIIESLMINHPHDCPVCAEGGECHLQDMTVMSGHRDRRYRGLKRTHRNQYLGPLVNHEMNRCIACYRCVRFYRDYAGGSDLAALGAHDHVYFGRHTDGVLQSEFAGNLVEVCPTGVFTDKPLAHDYTRKWDLQSAPSVCVACGVGCNTLPAERYGRLKRVHNRYNDAVNGYFLCDRGRFGQTFVNSAQRLAVAGVRAADGRFRAVSHAQATARLTALCAAPARVAGIGSPRASLESNWLLRKLVGADAFSAGFGAEEAALRAVLDALRHGAPAATLGEIEAADAVLILGEDLTQTAARVALALRQTVRNDAFAMARGIGLAPWQDAAVRNLAQDRNSPLAIISTAATRLDDIASHTARAAPADIARIGFAVAAALGGAAAAVDLEPAQAQLAARLAALLAAARRPLIVSGCGCLDAAVVQGADRVARALHRRNPATRVVFAVPECNSLGLGLLDDAALSLADLARRARAGTIDTLLVLENDLLRRGDARAVDDLLGSVQNVVVLDQLQTDTAARAHLALAVASFAECEGTLVSGEGRAQRLFPVIAPATARTPSWLWLSRLGQALGRTDFAGLDHVDAILAACAAECPALAGARDAAPGASYRDRVGLRIARQPQRYSGRTAMLADATLHEPRAPQDAESGLAFSMEGDNAAPPPALLPFVWAPGWNSNQSLLKFQAEIGGPLRGGPAGVRLIEPDAEPGIAAVPPPFAPRPDAWLLTPGYRLFGSEELSVHAPAIAELVREADIGLHPADAARLGVAAGDGVAIDGAGEAPAFPVRLDPSVPTGTAVFVVGCAATRSLRAGQWVALRAAPGLARRRDDVIASDRGAVPHD